MLVRKIFLTVNWKFSFCGIKFFSRFLCAKCVIGNRKKVMDVWRLYITALDVNVWQIVWFYFSKVWKLDTEQRCCVAHVEDNDFGSKVAVRKITITAEKVFVVFSVSAEPVSGIITPVWMHSLSGFQKLQMKMVGFTFVLFVFYRTWCGTKHFSTAT